MSPKVFRISKLVIAVVSAGLTYMGKQDADKALDRKIAKKVAEELAKIQK